MPARKRFTDEDFAFMHYMKRFGHRSCRGNAPISRVVSAKRSAFAYDGIEQRKRKVSREAIRMALYSRQNTVLAECDKDSLKNLMHNRRYLLAIRDSEYQMDLEASVKNRNQSKTSNFQGAALLDENRPLSEVEND